MVSFHRRLVLFFCLSLPLILWVILNTIHEIISPHSLPPLAPETLLAVILFFLSMNLYPFYRKDRQFLQTHLADREVLGARYFQDLAVTFGLAGIIMLMSYQVGLLSKMAQVWLIVGCVD